MEGRSLQLPKPSSFTALGTAGGPIPQPKRSQPAHLLMNGDQPVLLDCGEGVVGQLARLGLPFTRVGQVFLSHHHFDHIGSLFAIFGLNMMTQRQSKLQVFGPPGTRKICEGLFIAGEVPNAIGFGVPGQTLPRFEDFVEVRELSPGDVVELGEMTVTNCENTHYTAEDDRADPNRPLSLSYRFDMPDRSVLFTGDTGVSRAVEDLARGVDLFVGEMMDIDVTMGHIRRANPNAPEARIAMIHKHLSEHHLTPEQLGEQAAKAGASHVVAVHLANGLVTPETHDTYAARVASTFSGRVSLSEDLGTY